MYKGRPQAVGKCNIYIIMHWYFCVLSCIFEAEKELQDVGRGV